MLLYTKELLVQRGREKSEEGRQREGGLKKTDSPPVHTNSKYTIHKSNIWVISLSISKTTFKVLQREIVSVNHYEIAVYVVPHIILKGLAL